MTAKEEDSNDGGVADSERVLLLQDTGVITVRVGNSNDTWTFHRKLLTHHSPFFAAALKGSSKESTTITVELIEDNPSAFMLFVKWLYSGEVSFNSSDGLLEIACLAWALGEKLQCPVFQDRAMCQLIDSDNDGFHLQSETVRLIYKISPPSSKLRMFAVDELLWHGQFEPETETGTNNTHQIGAAEIMAMEDFNRDLLERLLEYGGRGCGDPAEKGPRYLKVLDYGIWGLDSS